MATYRCPTCIAILRDPGARRCPYCRQRLRRRAPCVLGDDRRTAGMELPIDQWLFERVHGEPGRRATAPVAWQDRFTTSPAAAPDALDPDVRALIDELRELARAEVAWSDETARSAPRD